MQALSEVLDELDSAVDRAHAVALPCHRPEDVAEWICRLQAVRARIEALCCNGVVAAGSLDVPALAGKRTVASVVAAQTGVDPRSVAADVGLGAWVERFPLFAEAFDRGQLTRRHVQVLRRVDNARTGERLAEAQEYLVEAASSCDWREFNQVLRYWELTFDPDGDEPREQLASRFCRLTKHADGSVDGRFRLDPVAGQAVLSALEQEEQRLFRSDGELDQSLADAIGRTPSQRRADALVNVMTRGAARSDGSVPAPLVHIVFGANVLDEIASGAVHRSVDALDPSRPAGRCELLDGTPIHPNAALAAMAAATVRRIVLAAPSEVLDLGRSTRSFPAKLKQALLVAARGRCNETGCDAPVGWLQADHVHPWHFDGPTAIANGQILCDPHNKAKRDRVEVEEGDEPRLE